MHFLKLILIDEAACAGISFDSPNCFGFRHAEIIRPAVRCVNLSRKSSVGSGLALSPKMVLLAGMRSIMEQFKSNFFSPFHPIPK